MTLFSAFFLRGVLVYLLVGLGNPGEKYAFTRHNIGFMFLDYFAEKHAVHFRKSEWQASVGKCLLWGSSLLLIKPETFMNLSGRPVSQAFSYFKSGSLTPERIIVVHDDLDLAPGRVRIVTGRGAGGHKGVHSIMNALSTKDFIRIRVGIGRPEPLFPVENFVLSRFSPEDNKKVVASLALIEEGARLIVAQGVEAAMNQINGQE